MSGAGAEGIDLGTSVIDCSGLLIDFMSEMALDGVIDSEGKPERFDMTAHGGSYVNAFGEKVLTRPLIF